jgi:CRP-like cAMP-binding protein
MDIGNYFGEIGAISNLRRTSSVLALNSMLIGKIKISIFRDFMSKNSNFQRKIKRKV